MVSVLMYIMYFLCPVIYFVEQVAERANQQKATVHHLPPVQLEPAFGSVHPVSADYFGPAPGSRPMIIRRCSTPTVHIEPLYVIAFTLISLFTFWFGYKVV